MAPADIREEREKREQLCRKLALGNIVQAHQFIASNASKGADALLQKKLRATSLVDLGYTAEALRKLGYAETALEKLGFTAPDAKVKSDPQIAKPARPAAPASAPAGGTAVAATDQLRALIDSGQRAEGLLSRGYNAVICRKAGISASELTQLGFDLHQLRTAYPMPELKRAGYSAMDLRRYYSGHELKQAGYSASDMRSAGFTPKQLLGFGYNENAITAGGFSVSELTDAGLSKRTVDRRKFSG